jgi:hypothetical protein
MARAVPTVLLVFPDIGGLSAAYGAQTPDIPAPK